MEFVKSIIHEGKSGQKRIYSGRMYSFANSATVDMITVIIRHPVYRERL